MEENFNTNYSLSEIPDLYYQCSSVGRLNETWLMDFISSIYNTINEDYILKNHTKVLYPSVEMYNKSIYKKMNMNLDYCIFKRFYFEEISF